MPTLRDPFFAPSTVSLDEMEQLQTSGMGSLRRGWEAGRIGAEANALGAQEASLRAAGDVQQADAMRAQITALQQRQGKFAPEVGRVEDIHGLGDAASWAAGQVGQGAASMVEPVGAATAMGAVGRVAGMLPGTAGKLGRAVGTVGGPLAAYGLNQRQLTGEFVNSANQDPELMARTSPQELHRTANLYGAGAAVLDTAFPAMVGRQLTGAGLRAGMKAMGPTMGVVPKTIMEMGGEGVTEAMQSYGSQQVQGYLNPNRDTSGDLMENVNSLAGGMIGSGPLAGAGALADAGYRRAGMTADQVGTKAGEMYDLAKGKYEGSALEGGVNAGKEKAKGLFGAARGKVVDLQEAARDEDGKVNLGKVMDLAGQEARRTAEEFLGADAPKSTRFTLDPETRNLLDENAFTASLDAGAPPAIVNHPDPQVYAGWRAEQNNARNAKIMELLEDRAEAGDAQANALADRVATGDQVAATEAALYLAEAADKNEVRSNADMAYAAGKLLDAGARAVGRGAVKVGKVAMGAAKDMWAAGKDEYRKKNAQGEDATPENAYAAWRERTGRAATDKLRADMEAAEASTKAANSTPQAKEEMQARKAEAQRRAELLGEILVAEAQGETKPMQEYVREIGFKMAEIAENWTAQGMKQGADEAALTMTMNNVAKTLRAAYGGSALNAVQQMREVMDPGAAPIFDYLAERVQKVGTAEGRAEAAAERKRVANQLMALVPPEQVARMQAHGGDYREQFLRTIEAIADGHADPRVRKAFEAELGKTELSFMLATVNGIATEGAPRESSMFGDSPETGTEDEFEARGAEKTVAAGAGGTVYGFHATPTFRGGNRRVDPFAADIDAKGDDKLKAEDEALQRKAEGERTVGLGKKRPQLFVKGQKLFGGADAIAKKVADLEKHLGVDQTPERMAALMKEEGNAEGEAKVRELMARNDEGAKAKLDDAVKSFFVNRAGGYKVSAKSALQVMEDLNYPPSKVLSLYRDYLRQDKQGLRANRVADALLDMNRKEGTQSRLSPNDDAAAERIMAQIMQDARQYFGERFIAVAERLSDRVPDKMDTGEVLDLVKDATKALDNIDGAARKRLQAMGLDADKNGKEFRELRNEMIAEGNFIYFVTADKKEAKAGAAPAHQSLPMRVSQLVGWAKAQAAQYEKKATDETGRKDNFKNVSKDQEFLAHLMSGINAVLASGYVKDEAPHMRDKFGRVESFNDGIPSSLQLATTTQYQRERLRKEAADKHSPQPVPVGPARKNDPAKDARRDKKHQTEVAKDQRRHEEYFVADPLEGTAPEPTVSRAQGQTMTAEEETHFASLPTAKERRKYLEALRLKKSGERFGDARAADAKTDKDDATPLDFFGRQEEGEVPDEFADAMYRTKHGGRSVYDPLPFETVGDAARKAEDRAGPILQALRGKIGTPEQGLNMIVQRIKAAETEYTKTGPAGGIQYLYPAAAALDPRGFEALGGYKGTVDGMEEHLSMLRGQVFRVLKNSGASPKHKVAIARLLATDEHAHKVTLANVNAFIAKRAAPDAEASLGYFPDTRVPERKDITKKELTPMARQDGKTEGKREHDPAHQPAFPGEYTRTRKHAEEFKGDVDAMNAAIERKSGQLNNTKLQTVANLAQRARDSIEADATKVVAWFNDDDNPGAVQRLGDRAGLEYEDYQRMKRGETIETPYGTFSAVRNADGKAIRVTQTQAQRDSAKAAPEVAATKAPKSQGAQSGAGNGLTITAHQSSGYRERTKHNADSAGLTVAVAANYTTAGERLTKSVAGDKYLAIPLDVAPDKGGVRLAKAMRQLDTTTLNVAGNGIYTLAPTGHTQASVNQHVYDLIAAAHALRPIMKIVTGGQTGVDLAGAVAAYKLGIPAVVTLPKGFVQRDASGKDSQHTAADIERQIVDGAAALSTEGDRAGGANLVPGRIGRIADAYGDNIIDMIEGVDRTAVDAATTGVIESSEAAFAKRMTKEDYLMSDEFGEHLAALMTGVFTSVRGAKGAIDEALMLVDQTFAQPAAPMLAKRIVSRLNAVGTSTLGELMGLYVGSTLPASTQAIAKAVRKVAGKTPVHGVGHLKGLGLANPDRTYGVYRTDRHDIMIRRDAPNLPSMLLHEGVHAATGAGLTADPELHRAAYALMAHIADTSPRVARAYGMTNVMEFMAEGLSNLEFQKELKKIPASPVVAKYLGETLANAWDAFVGLVRAALNLAPEHQSALSQMLDLAGRAMKLQAADPNARSDNETLMRREFVPAGRIRATLKAIRASGAVETAAADWLDAEVGMSLTGGRGNHGVATLLAILLRTAPKMAENGGPMTQVQVERFMESLGSGMGPRLMPTTLGGRKLNAQANPTASQGTAKTASQADIVAATTYVNKVLGPKYKVLFEQLTGHSGEFIEADLAIKIAIGAAAGTMSTAYHEALHAFFARYVKGEPRVLEVMKSLAENQTLLDRVTALLDGYPAAQAQLTSGEERLAYIYQFYAAGLLDLPSGKGKNWLQRLVRYFRRVLGTLRADERATDILDAFHDGKLADQSSAGAVVSKLAHPSTWSMKTRRNLDGLIQMAAAAALPAQTILNESKSNTAKALMRTFYANPGAEKDGAKGEGFLNAVKSERTRRNNAIMKALEEGGLTARDHKAVVAYLQKGTDPIAEPDKIPYAPHRRAVAMIRAELEDFHQYLTGKGVDVGYIQDYFPVVWDSDKLAKDPSGFADMLVENYPEQLGAAIDGTKASKREAAMQLTMMLIDRQVFDGKLAPQREDGVLIPFFESSENRTLDWIKPEHREPWLSKELIPTMTRYFGQGVRAAEYTERFGAKGERLDAALKLIDRELSAEGAKMVERGELKDVEAGNKWAARQYRDVRMAVAAMEGTLGKDISETRRNINSWMVVYQNLRLLPLSLFSSFVDPLSILARGGDFKLAGEAFMNGMREVLRGWKEMIGLMPAERQQSEWEQMAEFIGATESALLAHHVSEEYSSQYMSPRAKKINDFMFKFNGMEAWNRAMRVAATKGAAQFLIKHKDLPDSQHSRRWLTELGMKPDDIYVDGGRLIVDKHELAALTGMDLAKAEEATRKVQFAMNRWIEGAVLTPNSAQRPAWSSDPRWSFIFHLKQFTYSFQQTILARAWNEAKHDNLAPMGSLALFVPTMIAADMTKGLLVGGGSLPPYMKGYGLADWIGHGIERGGSLGYGQIALDAVRDPASLGGPMVEQVIDGFRQPLLDTAVKALPANAIYKNAVL